MKKFNKSLILPIVYAAISAFSVIYLFVSFKFGDATLLFIAVSIIGFLASVTAAVLTDAFKLNLKKNCIVYIISTILTVALFLVCLYFYSYINDYVFALIIFIMLAVQAVVFVLRKAPIPEVFVWIFLNPVLIFGVLFVIDILFLL